MLSRAVVYSSIVAAALALTSHTEARLFGGMPSAGGGGGGGGSGIPATGDEFVGPFSNWKNVKTDYGAVGDGSHDDTANVQACFDALNTGTIYSCWVPAGTYKITAQLNLSAKSHINVIGEDPNTTTLLWAGGSSGILLSFNRNEYSRVSRLTFDGGGASGVLLVDHSAKNPDVGFFDGGNEFADDFYQNGSTGFRCGVGTDIHGVQVNGCLDLSLLRNKFKSLNGDAIVIGNANAIGIWIRNSRFEDVDGEGVNVISGGYNIYNSVFHHSAGHPGVADLTPSQTPGSVRGNFSIGANQFYGQSGGSGNPFVTVFQGNTILDTVNPYAIEAHHQGPIILYDNKIRSLGNQRGTFGVVFIASPSTSDAVALFNTFSQTAANPIGVNDKITEIGTVIGATVTATEPAFVTEPRTTRTIFNVAAGNAADIQTKITAAQAQNGNRPVVHIPTGTYGPTSTVTIPANSDVQIIGDGYSTELDWGGATNGVVFALTGPSKATLRDFACNGFDKADCVKATGIDQVGSRVFFHHGTIYYGTSANIFSDHLDNTAVDFEDVEVGYQDPTFVGSAGFRVVGGTLAAAGTPAAGRTVLHSGSTSGMLIPYNVSNGGSLVSRDAWYEWANVTQTQTFLSASGRANATLENLRVSMFNPSGTSPTPFDISNLNGKISLINLLMAGTVVVSGNGSNASVLMAGNATDYTPSPCCVSPPTYFQTTASPAATSGGINNQEAISGPGTQRHVADWGTHDTTFVTGMFAQARATGEASLTALPDGVSDVRIFRIFAQRGINNFRFSP